MSAGGRQQYRAWVAGEQREAAQKPRCMGAYATRWNTGDQGNIYAYSICTRCPLPSLGDCKPYPGVTGVIVAGVAYDDQGRAVPQCPACLMPMTITAEAPEGECKRIFCPTRRKPATPEPQVESAVVEIDQHRPAAYRRRITEMTLTGATRAEIAKELNLPERGIRAAQTRWGLTGKKLAAQRAAMGNGSAA